MKWLLLILSCVVLQADIAVTNNSTILFLGDSLTDEQEGIYSEPWPHLVEAFYTLRNPSIQLHCYTHGRGGDVIVGDNEGVIYNDSLRTNYARYETLIGWNFTGPSNFVFVSLPYNDSGLASNLWRAEMSQLCSDYVVGSNSATPVLVTSAPLTNGPSQAGKDRAAATVEIAIASNWPYADIFTTLTNRMATTDYTVLRWQDITHSSNRWHMAWGVLAGLGVDSNASSAIVSMTTGNPTATNFCVLSTNALFSNGAVTFTRYDYRLPMPHNLRLDEALPFVPEVEGMNWHSIAAVGHGAVHQDLFIDGTLVKTLTSQQLSNGFNLFTLTNTSYTTQGLHVLNLIRDKHGLNRTNLDVLSPQSGVNKFISNSDANYDWEAPPDVDGRVEGAALISAMAVIVEAVRALDTNIHNAAQPLPRRFALVATNAARAVIERR